MNGVLQSRLKSGDRFGRWTVLRPAEPTSTGMPQYLCRCDCGTERIVLQRYLLYGDSLSCGCLRKERALAANVPDLTGQQFGDLTVVARGSNSKRNAAQWLCRCNCGAEVFLRGSLLLNGKRTHCGGKPHKQDAPYSDITGQRFGHLIALRPTEKVDKRGYKIWYCRCDCGRELEIPYNSLVHSHQISCGCQKKVHDQKLHTYLTHVAGTSVDMLKSQKIPTNNSTGYRGVYLVRGKYMAKIVFQKKQYFLGFYHTIEAAAEARKEAEEVLFREATAHYQAWKLRADVDPAWAESHPIEISVHQSDGKLCIQLMPELRSEEHSELAAHAQPLTI